MGRRMEAAGLLDPGPALCRVPGLTAAQGKPDAKYWYLIQFPLKHCVGEITWAGQSRQVRVSWPWITGCEKWVPLSIETRVGWVPRSLPAQFNWVHWGSWCLWGGGGGRDSDGWRMPGERGTDRSWGRVCPSRGSSTGSQWPSRTQDWAESQGLGTIRNPSRPVAIEDSMILEDEEVLTPSPHVSSTCNTSDSTREWKVKVLVAQSCLTLSDPPLSMGFFRQEYWSVGCQSLLHGIFPTQGSNPGLLYWRLHPKWESAWRQLLSPTLRQEGGPL